MIEAAMQTACSVRKTAGILKLSEDMVRKDAVEKGISADD